jgi:hypothetical protein
MLPDWMFSTRVERALRGTIDRQDEQIRFLQRCMTDLTKKLAEIQAPGVTRRIEAAEAGESHGSRRVAHEPTAAERQIAAKRPAPLPGFGPNVLRPS